MTATISLYGCGVVSPSDHGHGNPGGVAKLRAFSDSMWTAHSGIAAAECFHGSMLVGNAKFNFEDYRGAITRIVNEKRYFQLQKSAGEWIQFAMGATLDAVDCCPGLEELIRRIPHRVSTIIGTGLGDVKSSILAHSQLEKAEYDWFHFWGGARAKEALLSGVLPAGLEDPGSIANDYDAFQAKRRLFAYFADQNPALAEYLRDYAAIERRPLGGSAEASLINQLKAKATDRNALRKKLGAPMPPWESVSPNLLWNIPNLAAAQVSMLYGTHGLTIGASAACSTFALAVRLGLDEIKSGRADVAIVGATDNNPQPEIIAAFQGARVGAFGNSVVQPMTELRGTHVAGGACVWILCRDDVASAAGLSSLGVRVRGISVTSDGEHVITPSADGPTTAVQLALADSNVEPSAIQSWDLHCTGTPGDVQELDHIKKFAGKTAVMTARKGMFGHGMAACGGWELTAQLFSPRYVNSSDPAFTIPPSWIEPESLASAVQERGLNILTKESRQVAARIVRGERGQEHRLLCAKLNMGVGGVSSCIICERTEMT